MTYYAVMVAWSLRYTIFSINTAWGADATGFFQHYIEIDRRIGSVQARRRPARPWQRAGGRGRSRRRTSGQAGAGDFPGRPQ